MGFGPTLWGCARRTDREMLVASPDSVYLSPSHGRLDGEDCAVQDERFRRFAPSCSQYPVPSSSVRLNLGASLAGPIEPHFPLELSMFPEVWVLSVIAQWVTTV
jgi:hypothetical protein